MGGGNGRILVQLEVLWSLSLINGQIGYVPAALRYLQVLRGTESGRGETAEISKKKRSWDLSNVIKSRFAAKWCVQVNEAFIRTMDEEVFKITLLG